MPAAELAHSLPAATRRGVWSRVGHGMGFPLRGARHIGKNPTLIPLCMGPVLTVTALLVVLFTFVAREASSLAARFGHGDSWLGRAFGAIVMVLALVVFFTLVYFIYAVLVSVASSPFCGTLSERVEGQVTGVAPPRRAVGVWLREAGRGVGHALLRSLTYLCIAGPLWFFGTLLPPVAPFLTVLGFYVTSMFLAYDFLDYPLSTRAVGFGEKWRFVDGHRAESLGFGFVTGLLLLVPLVNLFVAPIAAVGATLLYLDLSKRA